MKTAHESSRFAPDRDIHDGGAAPAPTCATRPARSPAELSLLYGEHCKPKLQRLLALLGMDRVYAKASGAELYPLAADGALGAPVLDLLGGYGSTILGHNHPELKRVLVEALESDAPMHVQASVRGAAAVLGEALDGLVRRQLSVAEHYRMHLANSGTEAVEAAIKHALLVWSEKRADLVFRLERIRAHHPAFAAPLTAGISALESMEPVLLAFEGSFHGKTAGAVSATWNADYSQMYGARPLRVEFVSRSESPARLAALFGGKDLTYPVPPEPLHFSPLAGVLVEVIQGEGGIREAAPETLAALRTLTAERRIPLIVDEIQTGFYRTGRMFACELHGLVPDYLLLGKSLGGGLTKTACVLVRADHYDEEFGVVHTSTFAEDELSSAVALRTLALLDEQGAELSARAAHFETRIRDGFRAIAERHPGIVAEVRGRGFLLGIQFTNDVAGQWPGLLDALNSAKLTTYLYASYLLERHGLRVAPTLTQSNTIRLEPAALVGDAEIDRILVAFEDLCGKIEGLQFVDLTAHLFPNAPPSAPGVRSGTRRSVASAVTPQRTIAFLTHAIDLDTVARSDPFFAQMDLEERRQLLAELQNEDTSQFYHEQVIDVDDGVPVCLRLYGVINESAWFEESLRAGDRRACEAVRTMVRRAKAEGATYVGLGQFTSIVTDNGLLLDRLGLPVTTGNSLTVGLGYEGLLTLAREQGLDTGRLSVGIVGAAGNIGQVMAQMLGDHAREMVLVHREPLEQSPRFQTAVERLVAGSTLDRARVKATSDLHALRECEVVMVTTNATRRLIQPEHLAPGAIVLDLSVPSNLDPSIAVERPDVLSFEGGYAKLPKGQRLDQPLLPAPDGQIFACMAETITVGALGFDRPYSYGALTKPKVVEVLALAARVGLTLGGLKRERSR